MFLHFTFLTMTIIELKRVYEPYDEADGYRVLVDRLWPRGVKKENLKYDLWDKSITPSNELRKWVHAQTEDRWTDFAFFYEKELNESGALKKFADEIRDKQRVTLLYASKNAAHNHALILKDMLSRILSDSN